MTAFNSPIPDRINMLQPGHSVGNAGLIHDSVSKADNVNQFTVYNTAFEGGPNVNTCILGALATAPDSTNTAQKIIENTNNGFHVMQAVVTGFGDIVQGVRVGHAERLAVMAKAAERTRVVLMLTDGGFPAFPLVGGRVQCVFDLANGQIGVPATVTNAGPGPWNWQALGQSITALGNGWYICTMDVVVGNTSTIGWVANVLIDNGSGNNAASISYTGDGSSGIYTWRASCLPPRAYGLTQQLFFDDFTSLATIDVSDTRGPGFNWYVHNQFNIGPPADFPAADPSQLSINPASVLKIVPGPAVNLTIASVAGLDSPSYASGFKPFIGTVFTIPYLMEARLFWDVSVTPPVQNSSFWTHDIVDYQTTLPGLDAFKRQGRPSFEQDWYENLSYRPTYTAASTSSPSPFSGFEDFKSSIMPIDSYPVWNPAGNYSQFQIVYFSGVWYVATAAVLNINRQPPNPTYWTVISAPTPNLIVDFLQFHTYSALWIPYVGETDFGQVLVFLDGIFCCGFCYGPESIFPQGNIDFQVADKLLSPIFLGCGQNYSQNIDWVSVYGLPQTTAQNVPVLDSAGVIRNIVGFA